MKSKERRKISMQGLLLGIVGLATFVYFIFRISEGIQLPALTPQISYGLLFLVGLLTGLHCVSMCGGFVVSYTAKALKTGKNNYRNHLMYGFGKTASYIIIGAAFGLLGSIIAFTPLIRGVAGIIAGCFLMLFGLKMLNIIPVLRRWSLPQPRFLSRFTDKKSASSPLIIGLLNGLMIACGPLQAIYVMAAGTGSVVEGAKLLFIFALGTLPVMLSFGYITSFVSLRMTHKLIRASGVVVIILGLLMLNNGLALTGTGYDFQSLTASTKGNQITGEIVKDGYQEIRMEVNRYGWEPDKFVLKRGMPVKWIINGKEINGCNNAIQVPKLGLNFDIKKGEQVIEFTPQEAGIISWSCWMGMIQGTFIVKDRIDISDSESINKELSSITNSGRSSCGGSCGNPSCGASGSSCGCGVN